MPRHFTQLSIPFAALLLAVVATPASAQSQLPRPNQLPPPGGAQQRPAQPLPPPSAKPGPQQPPAAAAVAPYQPVAIRAPKPVADPSYEAFRNQIAEIAKKKDKKALAALVSPAFFWMGEKGDRADKKKPMVESLAKRLEQSPRDVESWIKLMRSRTVLGEPKAAKETLERALKIFGEDRQEREQIIAAARTLGLLQ